MSFVSRRSRNRALLALFATAVTITAHAQSAESKPEAKRHNSFYLSAYLGENWAKSGDVRIMQPAIGTDATYHDVNWDGKSFKPSQYYGVRFGYYLPKAPNVALDFEYNHAKMYARVDESKLLTGTWLNQPVNGVETMKDRVGEYRITNGINTLAFNLIYRFPVAASEKYPNGRWQPYVGAGPQYFILYSFNNINGRSNKHEYHPSGWGWQVFTGIRYMLTPHFGLFAETKYQNGDAHSILADDGRGDTDIRNKHLLGGAYYQF